MSLEGGPKNESNLDSLLKRAALEVAERRMQEQGHLSVKASEVTSEVKQEIFQKVYLEQLNTIVSVAREYNRTIKRVMEETIAVANNIYDESGNSPRMQELKQRYNERANQKLIEMETKLSERIKSMMTKLSISDKLATQIIDEIKRQEEKILSFPKTTR